jgi:hypothetical protein
MPASINLVGIAANFPNPGTYVEVDFASGPSSGYGGLRTCVLLGNKTSAGSATNDTVIYGPDTPVTCIQEQDVITLFGAGSQLHRMFLRFTSINKTTPLYFVAVTSSAGAAATATITLTTTATGNGTLRVWVADDFVDTSITSGQSVTTIATAVVASIKTKTRWPVTASSSVGVVTVTAVEPGLESNWIRVQSQIIGTGVGTTTSLTANTFMSGGTTADSNATALTTIQPAQFYYVVSGDSDATNLGALNTQVLSNAQPTTGILSRAIGGSMDTSGNAITVATGINSARCEVVWGTGAVDWTPAELAAFSASLYMLLEAGGSVGVARMNFSQFPASATDQASWPIIPSRNGLGSAPTSATITSCLNNGLTPWGLTTAGVTGTSVGGVLLVKRCTTRSLNGSFNDYRIRDAHKVTICDYFAADLRTITQQQFGGKKIVPDPVPGQPAPDSTSVSPKMWGSAIAGLVGRYDKANQWQPYPPGTQNRGGDWIIANSIFQAETSPPTRMSSLLPLIPINIADQFCALLQQVA